MPRFELNERLSAAVAEALPLARNAEDAATLTQCAREVSISLAEVQLISRLLILQSEQRDAAEGGASSKEGRPLYVHELLLGASPVLPACAAKAPAHPALAPRLNKLRAAQEDRDYARMVGGVVRDEGAAERDAAEMNTYRSQLGIGVNLIVSMATMFTAGAYAGGTEAEPFGVRAVCCGLAMMLLTMGVEMGLFLIGAMRVDAQVHRREVKAKSKGVQDRTQLSKHMHAWKSGHPQG